MTLDTFENPYPNRRYEIEIYGEEFSAICPITKQPDFAKIKIRYIPDEQCVELKSLKMYLQSYRNQLVFHEAVVNKIADDLLASCDPWFLEIVGEFNIRGGLRPIVKVQHKK